MELHRSVLVVLSVMLAVTVMISLARAPLYPPRPDGTPPIMDEASWRLERDQALRVMAGRTHLPRREAAERHVQGLWFPQRLDHFSNDNRTFFQRYAVNNTFWKPGTNSPVFSTSKPRRTTAQRQRLSRLRTLLSCA